MISDTQVQHYRDHGYVVVEDVLDPAILAELRTVTEHIVSEARGLTDHNGVYDLEPSHRADAPRVRRIKLPHKVDPFYRTMAADPGVIAALKPLLGANIRLHGGKLNMKSAEYGAPVEWHQDWAFYPHTNDDVLAVGIMLDDVDLENGPLLVMPDTHQGALYDHHADGAFCGAIDPERCDLDFESAVPLTGRAGSMTVHHARLVHGSSMNTSARQRRLLLFEFTAADAWPLLGVQDFDDFNDRVVAGQPTLVPRLVPAPIRMPFPKAPHQGSIYENQRSLSHRYFEHDAAPQRVAAT